MEDKSWQDWQNDVEKGLKYLLADCEQVIIIGLSMGALLGLELAAKYPNKINKLILLSPALKFKNPLTKYTPEISKYVKKIPGINLLRFSNAKLAETEKGYSWFPAKTFMHFWLRTQHFDSILEKINIPTLIIHSKKDKLANPTGAEHIYQTIKSENKTIIWLEKSGHEILLDIETNKVLDIIKNSKFIY